MKDDRKESRLFSHPEVLDETIEENPLKYQQNEIDRIKNYILRQLKKNKPKIVAYLAPYGSGKSVVLNNVLKELPEKYKKIQFDIWQCSSKKDIWESFLIKTLSELEYEKEKKIIDRIDGTRIRWRILNLFFLCYLAASFIAWFLLKEPNCEPIRFLRAFLIYAAPVFIALAGINRIFPIYESKMKTLAQYKDELSKVIRKNNQPVVIIIEDVDRSGNDGQRFLETLKCFLEDIGDKSLLVICPQRDYSFGSIMYKNDDSHWDSVAKLENSIKIYEDVIYGTLSGKVTEEQVQQLMKSAGCYDKKLVETVKLAVHACSDASLFTMRSLNFLLRGTVTFAEINEFVDPSVTFFFLARRFLDARKGISAISMTDSITHYGISLTAGDNNPEIDLVCHVFDIDLNMYRDFTRIEFKFVADVPEWKYKIRKDRNAKYIICNINRNYEVLTKTNK